MGDGQQDDLFIIQDPKSGYWMRRGYGYTGDRAMAYRYTKREAEDIIRAANPSVGLAMELAELRRFYIATTNHGYVGNAVVFWGPDGNGYVTDVESAGRYTAQEVASIVRGDNGAHVGIPCAVVDAKARSYLHADDFHGLRAPERTEGGERGE